MLLIIEVTSYVLLHILISFEVLLFFQRIDLMKQIKIKKRARFYFVALLVIFCLGVSYYLYDRFSYATEAAYFPVENKKDSMITIGIIGDSWVFGKKLDSSLKEKLLEKGISVNILSSGQEGAKSKLIYQNIFKEKASEFSSKFVIEKKPEYCIVIAGVNDALGQVGPKFYAHHVYLIVKTLLHYNIKPIIVELPEFDIIDATNEMGLLKKTRNRVFARFTNNGHLDNIKDYRNSLTKLFTEKNLTDSILFIDFDKVCIDFNRCKTLFSNHSHLSTIGNKKLSEVIANDLFIKEKYTQVDSALSVID